MCWSCAPARAIPWASWPTASPIPASAPNLGILLNRRNVFFVPFGQDDYEGKPASLVADFTLVPETIEAAVRGEQLQPLLLARR